VLRARPMRISCSVTLPSRTSISWPSLAAWRDSSVRLARALPRLDR